jgi:hypothetical protein
MALGEWSVNWLFDEMRQDDVDAETLTWWLHRRVDIDKVPPGRTVIQIDHTEPKRQSLWTVIDRGEVSVCLNHPGYDVDVIVTCPTIALAKVFSGHDSWRHAVTTGAIRIDGPPHITGALPRLFRDSPFAPAIRTKLRLESRKRAAPARHSA